MKRLLVAAAVSMATLMGVALLWNFRGAAALFVVSLAVAAMLRPLVARLERRLGRVPALVAVYLGGLVLFGVFAYVATHGFLRELDEGIEHLRVAYERLQARGARAGATSVHGFLLRRMPPAASLYEAVGGARTSAMLTGVLGLTLNAIDSVGRVAIVVALSAYWNSSRESFERVWLSLLPPSGRARAREIWRPVERAVGAHLRSELAQSLLCVLILGLTFRLVRMPMPMLPALAAGLCRLVPFFGFVVAGATSFLAGAVVDPSVGALAAGYTLLVLLLLDRVVARGVLAARRYSPTLTVFLIVALVDVYGVLGVLVASPLAAATQVFVERLVATRPRKIPSTRSLAEVETRLERARQRLELIPAPEAAKLRDVVTRLGVLAEEVRGATET
jgi:predicted PurR-regulated permease PerM